MEKTGKTDRALWIVKPSSVSLNRAKASEPARPSLALKLLAWAFCFLVLNSPGNSTFAPAGEPIEAIVEGRAGTAPSDWRLDTEDSSVRVLINDRLDGSSSTGESIQHLKLRSTVQTDIHLTRPVTRARVNDELSYSIRVRTDRVQVQLFAHVILPRTKHPHTGKPLAVLLDGSIYRQIGVWDRVELKLLTEKLNRSIRALREEYRSRLGKQRLKIDGREAYVNRLVLKVYDGSRQLNVWLGEPKTEGLLPVDNGPIANADVTPVSYNQAARGSTAAATIRMNGETLLVNNSPFFPRMLQYQGEPLSQVIRRGFNTLWFDKAPAEWILMEAKRLDFWIVCPPPQLSGTSPIADSYDRVLAWDLGSGLSQGHLSRLRQQVEHIRRVDPIRGRPLIGAVQSETWSHSRLLDILWLDVWPPGTSFEMSRVSQTLRTRKRLARPGTPVWVRVPTQLAEQTCRQLTSLKHSPRADFQATNVAHSINPALADVEFQQLRLLTHAALASGARGICYGSRSPLASRESASVRFAMLELLNLELSLIQPWIGNGTVAPMESLNDNLLQITSYELERSRLLVVLHIAPGAQYTVSPPDPAVQSFTASGTPASYSAYEILPAELRRLSGDYAKGGIRVVLDRPAIVSLVLLTADPLALKSFGDKYAQMADRPIQLYRQIVEAEFSKTEQSIIEASRHLAAGAVNTDSSQALAAVRKKLDDADYSLERRRAVEAGVTLSSAHNYLARIRREQWEQTVREFRSPVSSPCCVSFTALPLHWPLREKLSKTSLTDNLLAGGEFENLDWTKRAGWRHHDHITAGLSATVELSSEKPFSGEYSLRLSVVADDPEATDRVIESAPLWITSPAISVTPGSTMRIHGWVRCGDVISGSNDGLLIVDSIGSVSLAERIRKTNGWQEFTLYRQVQSDQRELSVTFAMTGLGEVFLDGITIQAFGSAAGPQSNLSNSIPPRQLRPQRRR